MKEVQHYKGNSKEPFKITIQNKKCGIKKSREKQQKTAKNRETIF